MDFSLADESEGHTLLTRGAWFLEIKPIKMVYLFFNPKRLIPKEGEGRNQSGIIILMLVSILCFISVKIIPFWGVERMNKEMVNASRIMMEAITKLRECQYVAKISIDRQFDPNQTGLIGIKFSPLTTSLGQLEAKRTTTNPNFAALVVFLLREAGVSRGETIAVGASSSFPSLIVAVLSGAKALGLKPLLISSLGASQWGANRPDFHWLLMHDCLEEAGVFEVKPIAMSLGGDHDRGEEMKVVIRSLLRSEVEKRGIMFIDEPDLSRNVDLRMALYDEQAGKDEIKAFINIGGSWSNIGTDVSVLELKPGLAKSNRIHLPEKGGVIHEMAARNIPVIHLLNIRGLISRYGLPWDPIPLPQPGEGRIYLRAREKHPLFFMVSLGYLLFVSFFIVWRGTRKRFFNFK